VVNTYCQQDAGVPLIRRWHDELNGGDYTLMLKDVGVERQEAEHFHAAPKTALRRLTPIPLLARTATLRL
jgi:hypothetical protein